MVIEVRPATLDDARDLAPRLRAADAAEARALGFTPEQALVGSVDVAQWAEAYVVNGVVEAITGLGTREGQGVPWLAGSDAIGRHPKFLLRESRRQIARMLGQYKALGNVVDANNGAAIAYLRRLGFTIDAPRDGFHRFHLRAA